MPVVSVRVLAASTLLAASGAAQSAPISLDQVLSGSALSGVAPARPTWSPDSRWLAFLWNNRQQPTRDIWIVARDGTGLRPLRAPADTTATRASVSELLWTRDGRALLVLAGGTLSRVDLATGVATVRASLGADASTLTLSPDGAQLAYLADGDLWLLGEAGAPRRVTSESQPFIGSVALGTYARRDVEIGTGTWAGDGPVLAWSPDGRTLAVHHVDRRPVRRFQIPYYLGDTARFNLLRRGAPGDTNEARRVGLVDVATGRLSFVALPAPTDAAIVSFEWSPRGALLIDRQSDDAIDRRLYVLDSPTSPPREVWSDPRATRVYTDAGSAWHPDGRRLFAITDRDDRYRLVVIDPATGSTRAITPATSDLLGVPAVIPATQRLLFGSNAAGASERQLYLLPMTGGTPLRITQRPGTHAGVPSPDGTRVAVISSDDVTPPELWLAHADGRTEQRVTTSPSAALASLRLIRPRYFTVRHRRDSSITLSARIYEPPGLDPTRRHPVLFGPVYSNTVRNRWGGQYGLLQQYLALTAGYLVVQVDVRGSTGYGRAFRESFLMDWGGGDLTDLESVVEHLAQWPTVDRQRMGIWGSSYGGTLTVYSMLRKPGLFAAGVAGAPAVDPKWFGSDDVAIARRPQSHPSSFVQGRVFADAAAMRDPLLIIHGMEDDVVPFQTSVVLFDELLRLGKPVDLAFAPAATHGWSQRPMYARYLFGRLIDHFDRVLKR
jgi:dipeptidyl-peptidase 4